MWRWLRREIQVIFERDPAAKSVCEVLTCYPGFHALLGHRVGHALYRRRFFFLARLVSHLFRFLTGIEIHPGAIIGEGCFIDHGMGVVIGETAELGRDVTLYQGVTLGGTGKEKGKRHPTLEDGVMVGVGAKVLGGIIVGAGSKVGAGAVVVKPVPPGCTVVGVPGRVVARNGVRVGVDLEHGNLPDPVSEVLSLLSAQVAELQKEVAELREAKASILNTGPS